MPAPKTVKVKIRRRCVIGAPNRVGEPGKTYDLPENVATELCGGDRPQAELVVKAKPAETDDHK